MIPSHQRASAIILAACCAAAGLALLAVLALGEPGRGVLDPPPLTTPTPGPDFLDQPPSMLSTGPCGNASGNEPLVETEAFVAHIIEHEDGELPSPVGLGYLGSSRLLAVGLEVDGRLQLEGVTLFGDSRGRVHLAFGNTRQFAIARGDESLFIGLDPESRFLTIGRLAPGADPSSIAPPIHVDLRGLRLGPVPAIAASSDGTLIVLLDDEHGRLLRLSLRRAAAGAQSMRLAAVCEAPVASETVVALAVAPDGEDVYLLARAPELTVLRLDANGDRAAAYSLAEADVANLTAMVFAPSADTTDPRDTEHLYILEEVDGRATRTLAVAWNRGPEPPPDPNLVPQLVSVMRAFEWVPPSADPTGIEWDAEAGHLVVTDSEIDELPIFEGSDVWFVDVKGTVLRSGLLRRTSEPTDVAIDPLTRTMFISDDGAKRIHVVRAGADGSFGTADDSVTSLSTQDFGARDPEGLAFGQGTLFVAAGAGREIYRLSPGPNGRFDGVPPRGDDQVFSFDVASLGLVDPEGIAFSPDQATLYILDRDRRGPLMEVTTAGAFIRSIDLSSLGLVAPSGVVFAPASDGSDQISLYITDRGADNARNPLENDGRVLEVRVPGVP